MEDEDIEFLKALISSGKLHWHPDEKTCRKIVAIHDYRKCELEEDSEPGPVAYFSNGHYIALWGCIELHEFVLIEPVFQRNTT